MRSYYRSVVGRALSDSRHFIGAHVLFAVLVLVGTYAVGVVTGTALSANPTGPYRELQEGLITPDEYASRVRREVHERIREEPPPRRSVPVPPPAPPSPPDR
jgi:hypothetical protein